MFWYETQKHLMSCDLLKLTICKGYKTPFHRLGHILGVTGSGEYFTINGWILVIQYVTISFFADWVTNSSVITDASLFRTHRQLLIKTAPTATTSFQCQCAWLSNYGAFLEVLYRYVIIV